MMKYCRLCKTYHPEYDDNCPLCGAGLVEATDKTDENFDFAPYNANEKRRNARKTVRDVFIALSVLTLVGLLLASVISKVYSIIYIGLASVGFFWLVIGQFVFFRTDLRTFYYRSTFWLMILAILVCLHFGKFYIALSYVIPCAAGALSVVTLLTAVITKKWYRYAFHSFVLALFMIALFPLNYCLSLHYAGYNWIASIATLGVGLAEIAFSLIFGRQVLGSEIKKRFFV